MWKQFFTRQKYFKGIITKGIIKERNDKIKCLIVKLKHTFFSDVTINYLKLNARLY